MCCWCSPCRGSSRSSERVSEAGRTGRSGRSLRRTARNTPAGRRLRSARMFGNELRASARRRLRPANRYAIDSAQKARSRAEGLARADLRDANCSPPPGGGCGLPVATRPSSTQSTSQRTAAKGGCGLLRFHPEPQIQDSIFRIYELGAQLAKEPHERTCGREMRAFAGRSCGPLTSCEADTYTKSARIRADGPAT